MSPTPNPLPPFFSAIDEVVTSWPDVRGKNVFGHRGWIRDGKMLGFIADEGISVKALSPQHAESLYVLPGVKPFVYNGQMEMSGWPVLPVANESDVSSALSQLKDVYDALGPAGKG
jgi:hypothetical protein